MKNYLKILCLLLSLTLVVFMFAACSQGEQPDTSDVLPETDETQQDEQSDNADVSTDDMVTMPSHEPGLFVDGEKIDISTVMTVGENEISFDLFRYFYVSNKTSIDGGDSSIWATESEEIAGVSETLLEVTKQNVLSMQAIAILAAENNIELSQENMDLVDEELEYALSQFESEEEFNSWLTMQNMTEEVYRTLISNTLLLSEVIEQIYAQEITEDVLETFVHAQHILISKTDETATSDDASSEARDPQEVAQEVLQRAQDGEDFDALIKEFNEDYGQPAEGYYFTYGEMVQEFEDAAYALEENEISDIVETTYGYHILRKLPMEESYIEENLFSLMVGTQAEAELNNLITEMMADLDVEYDENFDKIAPDTLF